MCRYCLIGESDTFIARLLNRFAEESGLDVLPAMQGEDLLKLAQEYLPLVIIIDVELPGGLRGWDAFRELRANPLTTTIPIVSCSWLSPAQTSELIDEPEAFLQKPDLHYQDFLSALVKAGIKIEIPGKTASHYQTSEGDTA